MMFYRFFPFIISLLVLSLPAEGRRFKASYISFNLEGNWTCKNFYVEWVCHHPDEDKNPAIILIGAEELDSYETLSSFSGFIDVRFPLKVSLDTPYAQNLFIQRQNWMKNVGKALPPFKNYQQWKMATVCCDAGPERARIFVNFLAHSKNFSRFSNMFTKAIKSLKIDKNLTKLSEDIRKYGSKNPQVINYIQQILSGGVEEEEIPLKWWEKWELKLRDFFQNGLFNLLLVSSFYLCSGRCFLQENSQRN